MTKQAIAIRVIGVITFGLIFVVIFFQSGIRLSNLSPEWVLERVGDNTWRMLAMMLLLMLIQNVFTFIPFVLIVTMNIALFGFWLGYLYSVVCSVIGSTLIFIAIRHLFSASVSTKRWATYQQQVEKNGFFFVFSGRILPFMPTNLINIVSALSSMKVGSFIVATLLGNLIYAFVLSSASFGVLASLDNTALLIPFALLLLVGYFFFRRYRKKVSA